MERFKVIAERHPNKIAVDDGTIQLTYSQLERAATHLASRIDANVAPSASVGILIQNNSLFQIAALACLSVGRICVPIDLNYPIDRIEQISREAGLAAVVTGHADPVLNAPPHLPQLDIATSLEATDHTTIHLSPADQPAVVLYTSGSTGVPKGICNDQRSISQRVAQFTNACHLNLDDRLILLSSPGTIAGMRDSFAALLNGATLYVADPRRLGISGVLGVLEKEQITVCYAVPAFLRELLSAVNAARACRFLRIVRLGGDVALSGDIALCRAMLPPSCHLLIGYGSTEAPTTFQWFVPRDWNPNSSRVPIGYPVPDVSTTLVNEDGEPAAAGELAELEVRSAYVALGLWQGGRLLSASQSLRDGATDRVMRTGDILRMRKDGLTELIGRNDRMIKIRGRRVDPGEIEDVLRSCDEVADSAVVRIGDDERPTLVAFVVVKNRDSESVTNKLWVAISTRLPQYMQPARLRFIDAIPRLPGHKPDLPALAKLENGLLSRDSGSRIADARRADGLPSRIEHAVMNAWSKVLDQRSFEANLPWDKAGGDSLNALRLWFLIEEALGISLPLDVLDLSATPEELVAAVKAHTETATELGVSDHQRPPVVFFMPPSEGDDFGLAQLRAAFEGKVRFFVARYPSWRELARTSDGLVDIARTVAAQVIGASDESDIFLAGYSFGGFVAWEVAHELRKAGRQIRFVGLIDTRRGTILQQRQGALRRVLQRLHFLFAIIDTRRGTILQQRQGALRRVLQRLHFLFARPRHMHTTVFIWLIRALRRMSARRVIGAMGSWASYLPPAAAFTCQSIITSELRLHALRHWEPKPFNVPVWLFRSGEGIELTPDFGWGALTDQLDVVNVGGTHHFIFESPYREIFCARFVDALATARALVVGGSETQRAVALAK